MGAIRSKARSVGTDIVMPFCKLDGNVGFGLVGEAVESVSGGAVGVGFEFVVETVESVTGGAVGVDGTCNNATYTQ